MWDVRRAARLRWPNCEAKRSEVLAVWRAGFVGFSSNRQASSLAAGCLLFIGGYIYFFCRFFCLDFFYGLATWIRKLQEAGLGWAACQSRTTLQPGAAPSSFKLPSIYNRQAAVVEEDNR
jgi:hypothetical protein